MKTQHMTPANDIQVGGQHYKNSFQHWDLVAKLHLGYFEGQITKYVTRHRAKKGREDLEKAGHFTHKLMELVVNTGWLPSRRCQPTSTMMLEYQTANKLTDHETRAVMRVCQWSNLDDLKIVADSIARIILETYCADSGVPGPAYVNQDPGPVDPYLQTR